MISILETDNFDTRLERDARNEFSMSSLGGSVHIGATMQEQHAFACLGVGWDESPAENATETILDDLLPGLRTSSDTGDD